MDVETARQMVESSIEFVTHTGLRALELRRGYAKCEIPLAGNENHVATMYAGALFTLAEMAGGALFVSSFETSHFFAVVIEMNIRFVRPASGPVSIEVALEQQQIASIRDEVAQAGKARFELLGELKLASGLVVAYSRGVYLIRRVLSRAPTA